MSDMPKVIYAYGYNEFPEEGGEWLPELDNYVYETDATAYIRIDEIERWITEGLIKVFSELKETEQ